MARQPTLYDDSGAVVAWIDTETGEAFDIRAERAAAVEAIAAGIVVARQAAQAASADVDTANQLRAAALQLKTSNEAAKTANQQAHDQIASWLPQLVFSRNDLTSIRDQIAALRDENTALRGLLSTVLQAMADMYAYRASNNEDAALSHQMTAGLGGIVAGNLD